METMDCSKTGALIRSQRQKLNMTQKQLADQMNLSDKTVSKWERGLGCPDVSLLSELAYLLKVNIENVLNGELSPNNYFTGANMKKLKYYVCPVCGNLTFCTGNASISCCGRKLEALLPQKAEEEHRLTVEQVEDEWYFTSGHPMEKDHYISFMAFAAGDKMQVVKRYPEWNFEVRLPKREHGMLLWYCVQHGLFYQIL